MNVLNSFQQEKLSYSSEQVVTEVNIDLINEGYSQDANFLFVRKGDTIKIFDRMCNHNAGQLFLKGATAVCPLHGWELNLDENRYVNAQCDKKPIAIINEYEQESPLFEIITYKESLDYLPFNSRRRVEVTFFNHACLHYEIDNDFTFATDPWVIGSAFCNGWWLMKESPSDVFERLNDCDFIYISHNHPDHLHPLSLSHVRKDMPILTAGFDSGSTIELLKKEGFHNIVPMTFSTRLSRHEDELSFSVLKSGDFRDDSGLLIEIGEFKSLLTVDSNFLNFGKLPQNVHLLCSSFSGSASGFPICFDNYDEDEKRQVITRNRGGRRAINKQNIEKTKPNYFMPYAGFFEEKASRDRYVKERNLKNAVEDYQKVCDDNHCELLNVNKQQKFVFEGSILALRERNSQEGVKDLTVNQYISKIDSVNDESMRDVIRSYFTRSEFRDDLILDLRCTSDDFECEHLRFCIDFSADAPQVLQGDAISDPLEEYCLGINKRYLRIRARRDELYDVVSNGKPWEDLSIGFQCRIYRNPNVYNSEFWFYFTNVYIGSRVKSCGI